MLCLWKVWDSYKNVDELLTFKQYYELFYKIPVTNLDKPWVPSVVCQTCYQRLMDWGAKRRDELRILTAIDRFITISAKVPFRRYRFESRPPDAARGQWTVKAAGTRALLRRRCDIFYCLRSFFDRCDILYRSARVPVTHCVAS